MNRSLNLLIAAAAIASAAPLPALAQAAWSTTVVASAPRLTTQTRVPALNLERDVTPLRQSSVMPAHQDRHALKFSATDELGNIPEVEVRPKAEWSDDQGLRVGPTRLAYKSRF